MISHDVNPWVWRNSLPLKIEKVETIFHSLGVTTMLLKFKVDRFNCTLKVRTYSKFFKSLRSGQIPIHASLFPLFKNSSLCVENRVLLSARQIDRHFHSAFVTSKRTICDLSWEESPHFNIDDRLHAAHSRQSTVSASRSVLYCNVILSWYNNAVHTQCYL